MTSRIEEAYLEAEADIRNSNYHEAFQKFENILYEDPSFAPAHNSIGWIYKTQFDNYEMAETHFTAAMKIDPQYPHSYFHLASILIDLERYNELKKHLDKCLKISTVDKAWVYYRMGMLEEIKGNYDKAIREYKTAILNCFNNDKIKNYQADIERCKTKAAIAKEGMLLD
jgi:tetratricopeptide (TPR) repeat protein